MLDKIFYKIKGVEVASNSYKKWKQRPIPNEIEAKKQTLQRYQKLKTLTFKTTQNQSSRPTDTSINQPPQISRPLDQKPNPNHLTAPEYTKNSVKT